MKILGLIPARGGSKGIPGKNIKLLHGKPLLQYTSEVALESSLISKVILSSDDAGIIQVAKNLNIDVPFIRPQNLAEDKSATLSVIQHAIQFFREKNVEFDAVCLLQVTSPIRTVDFLDKAIQKFIKNDTDSLVSVQKVPHHYNPHWTFTPNEKDHLKISTGEKDIISRRQDLPITYIRDGSIYITKTNVLMNDNSLYGESISFIESPKEFYVNIDTIEDWKEAEELMRKQL